MPRRKTGVPLIVNRVFWMPNSVPASETSGGKRSDRNKSKLRMISQRTHRYAYELYQRDDLQTSCTVQSDGDENCGWIRKARTALGATLTTPAIPGVAECRRRFGSERG